MEALSSSREAHQDLLNTVISKLTGFDLIMIVFFTTLLNLAAIVVLGRLIDCKRRGDYEEIPEKNNNEAVKIV